MVNEVSMMILSLLLLLMVIFFRLFSQFVNLNWFVSVEAFRLQQIWCWKEQFSVSSIKFFFKSKENPKIDLLLIPRRHHMIFIYIFWPCLVWLRYFSTIRLVYIFKLPKMIWKEYLFGAVECRTNIYYQQVGVGIHVT